MSLQADWHLRVAAAHSLSGELRTETGSVPAPCGCCPPCLLAAWPSCHERAPLSAPSTHLCQRGLSRSVKSSTCRSSEASPAGPMPPCTTTMLPTAAAACAARGLGGSPCGTTFSHLPVRTSMMCTSLVAPARRMPERSRAGSERATRSWSKLGGSSHVDCTSVATSVRHPQPRTMHHAFHSSWKGGSRAGRHRSARWVSCKPAGSPSHQHPPALDGPGDGGASPLA